MKKKSVSLSIKIILIMLCILILSTVTLGTVSFVLNRNEVVRLNADKALSIARTIASAVDPEAYEEVLATHEKNDFWYRFKSFVDQTFIANNLFFLYVLQPHYDASSVYYFAEGFDVNSGSEQIDLDDADPIELYDPLMITALSTGQNQTTGIYEAEGFGYMVTGFAPIIGTQGQVIGVVGVDINVDEVMASSNQFGLMIILIVVALCIIMGIVIALYIKRTIGRPVSELSAAAERIALGDITIDLHTRSNDELGMLVESFRHMIDSTREQAVMMEALAAGDLTMDVRPRCEQDVINLAIAKMVERLSGMFQEINSSTSQVSLGSRQIADGAQSLAQGATEQAATMEQLSRSISEIAQQTSHNAEMSERAAVLAGTIKQNAEQGTHQMEMMIQAVQEINQASQSIGNVINVIDSIAFQTNILALNASVEAARAGQHGRGFAVVAEEVGTLAKKSSESARNTSELIANSIEKTKLGVQIADETYASLNQIVEGINQSNQVVNAIARSSEEQSEAIMQINRAISQTAQVIQQNSATAQESAAASNEMNNQAALLDALVSRFKLKDGTNQNLLDQPSRRLLR